MDPTLRILKLLSLLQTHRSWGGETLAEKLEVSPRTLRRDIDRLREFGYRISAERGSDGGYQLEVGSELPPLVLDDEEAVAMVVGLRANTAGSVHGIEEASLRALAKVEQVLPKRLQKQASALNNYVENTTFSNRSKIDVDIVVRIAQACRDCRRIEFDFTGGAGDLARRRVEPHKLVAVNARWYLLAWDNDRNDWRTFRSDRIANVTETDRQFAPRALPTENAAEYVKSAVSWTTSGTEVVIVFDATPEQLKKSWPATNAKFEELGEDRTRVTTRSESMSWMAMAAAVTGYEFTVEAPPELAEECRTLAARLQHV